MNASAWGIIKGASPAANARRVPPLKRADAQMAAIGYRGGSSAPWLLQPRPGLAFADQPAEHAALHLERIAGQRRIAAIGLAVRGLVIEPS